MTTECVSASPLKKRTPFKMFLSIRVPFQGVEEPLGRAGRLAVLADHHMHGMPDGENAVAACDFYFVFEANLHPRIGDFHGDLQEVVVAGWPQVVDARLIDREHQAALFDLLVADAHPADPFVAGALEEPEVVGVVHDAHLVGVAVEHPVPVRGNDHCARWTATKESLVCSSTLPCASTVLVTICAIPTCGA